MLTQINPRRWSREEQLAFALTLLLGVGAGVVLGYFVYAVGREHPDLGRWVDHSFRRIGFRGPTLAPMWWGLSGAFAAAALFYIRKLLRA